MDELKKKLSKNLEESQSMIEKLIRNLKNLFKRTSLVGKMKYRILLKKMCF